MFQRKDGDISLPGLKRHIMLESYFLLLQVSTISLVKASSKTELRQDYQ